MGQMLFLMPNQQCQSTEGNTTTQKKTLKIYTQKSLVVTTPGTDSISTSSDAKKLYNSK